MEEKRKYVRVPANAHIAYQIMPTMKILHCAANDLSRGGMRFVVSEPIPKGSRLKIGFTLSEKSFSFEAIVEIAWVRERPSSKGGQYEVGAAFVDMPAAAVDYLAAFIKNSSHT